MRPCHAKSMRQLIVIIPLLVCACVGPQHKQEMNYSHCPTDFKIVVEDAGSMIKDCPGNASDEGQSNIIPKCCAWIRERIIYAWESAPECITHELAHLCGHRTPEKDGFNWPGDNPEKQMRENDNNARMARLQ